MSTLILDETLEAKLKDLTERTELLGRAGQLLGHFIPAVSAGPPVPWDPAITTEELDRRRREPGGSTLAEFWQRMGRS